MTLEELIYKRLTENSSLQQNLARYAKTPAVFLQKAPDDTAAGWEKDKSQYPRCEYLVDMAADPERHSSGVVTVHIYSSEEVKPPEELAPAVREALRDVILQTDERPYAIAWDRTELFDMLDNQNPNTMVSGATLTFLLIAFPAQITKAPDPAAGVQEFLKLLSAESLVIGRDHIDDVYEPSDNRPAFYVRIGSYKTNRETYALRWVDCLVAVHVITPTPEGRAGWTRFLADALDIVGEVTLLDDSPMLVRGVEVDSSADYLTRGQLVIRAQYSIPNFGRYAHPLKQTNINGKGGSTNG